MTERPDDDARLGTLLRALPFPEPRPDFLALARQRYVEAMDARYRREVFTALLAAAVALGLAATVLLTAFGPATLIASVAVTIAGLAKWVDGIGIVLSQVPLLVWTSAVLVSVVSMLSALSLLRMRSVLAAK